VPQNLLKPANFALKFGSSVVCGNAANSFGKNLIPMVNGKSAVKKAKIDGILLGTRKRSEREKVLHSFWKRFLKN